MRVSTIGSDGQFRDADGRVYPSREAMELWPRPGRYAPPQSNRRVKRPSVRPFIENSIRTGTTYPRPGRYVTVSGQEDVTKIGPWGPLPYPQRDPLRPLPQHVAQPWPLGQEDVTKIGPWGPLPYPQRDPLRPMPQHVAQPWGLGQEASTPPDYYPQDPASSAYAVALAAGKPAEAMAFSRNIGDPAKNLYPGRFVVLKSDAQLKTQNGSLLSQAYPRTLWQVAFRPPEITNPLSVRLLSTEGKAIGSYIEIEVKDLLSQFLVVPKADETAVRTSLRQVPQPWIDGRIAPDRTSIYNLSASIEMAYGQLNRMPFERFDTEAFAKALPEIQGYVGSAIFMAVEALDMAGAAYDFDTIGRKAFNIVVCLGAEIFKIASDLYNHLTQGTHDQASISAFYAKVDAARNLMPYWAALTARAVMLTNLTSIFWMTSGYDFIKFFNSIIDNAADKIETDPNSFLTYATTQAAQHGQSVDAVAAQEMLRQGTERLKKLTAENQAWDKAFKSQVIQPMAAAAGVSEDDIILFLPMLTNALDQNKKDVIEYKKAAKSASACPPGGLGSFSAVSTALGTPPPPGESRAVFGRDLASNMTKNFMEAAKAKGGNPTTALKHAMDRLGKWIGSVRKVWLDILAKNADLQVQSLKEFEINRIAIKDEIKTKNDQVEMIEGEIQKAQKEGRPKDEIEHIRARKAMLASEVRALDARLSSRTPLNAEAVRQAIEEADIILSQAAESARWIKTNKDPENTARALEAIRHMEAFLSRGISKLIRAPEGGRPAELQYFGTELAGVSLGGQGTFWNIMRAVAGVGTKPGSNRDLSLIDDAYHGTIARTYLDSLGLSAEQIINNPKDGLRIKLEEVDAKLKDAKSRDKVEEYSRKKKEILDRISLLTDAGKSEVLKYLGDLFLRANDRHTLAREAKEKGQILEATRDDARDAQSILNILELALRPRLKADGKEVPGSGGYLVEANERYLALKKDGVAFKEGTEEGVEFNKWEEAFSTLNGNYKAFFDRAPKIIKEIETAKTGDVIEALPLLELVYRVGESMKPVREIQSTISAIAARHSWGIMWRKLGGALQAWVKFNLEGYNKLTEMLKNNGVGKAVSSFVVLPVVAIVWAVQLSIPLYVLSLFGFPRILVPTIFLQKVFETFFGIADSVIDWTKGDRQLDPFAGGEYGGGGGTSGATRMLLMGLGISMIFFGDKVFPAFGNLFTATSKVLESTIKVLTPKKGGKGKAGGASGRGPGRPRKDEAMNALRGLPPGLARYIIGG